MESALVPRDLVHKLRKFGLVTPYGDRGLWRITNKGLVFLALLRKD